MHIDLALFDGDALLVRGAIDCSVQEQSFLLESKSGLVFAFTARFEDPACPVSVHCTLQGKTLYRTALRVGVHTSDDWESIDLGGIHTLAFWCHDC